MGYYIYMCIYISQKAYGQFVLVCSYNSIIYISIENIEPNC